MRARTIALGIAVATATALAATAGGPLIATPNVGVAELDENTSGSASVSLSNTSASMQSVAMIAQDSADCDDATMVAAPQSFAIAGSSMQNVSVACNASASAGMRRCLYHVEDAGGSDLATFLGVCDASASTGAVLSPSPVTFPSVAVGSSAIATVMLTNLGSNASQAGTLHLQLTDLGGNFLLGAPCNPNVNGCDLPGTPLGSAAIDVICQPSAVTTFNATLYVVDSLGDRLTSPIPLTCTGTAPGAGPSIHVSTTPSPLDLRTVSVLGGSGSGNVHIQSVGTSPLTITSITLLGAGNNWTSSLGAACSSLPCNLAPQSALDVAVRFTPSAIGPGDARMVIASTDPVNSQVDIQLAGVGGGATLALAPGQTSSIDLGDVAKTGSASFAIQLVNAGDETATAVALALAGSPQFSITPPSMVDVPAGAPTGSAGVTLTCAPAGATGTFTTTFTASGSNVVGSSMVSVTATCHETDSPLLASPSYLALDTPALGALDGELRTGTAPGPFSITLKNTSASALTLSGTPTLSPATNVLSVTGPSPLTIPAMGSAQMMVSVDDSADATIATAIIASDTNGDSITIPVTGALATASFSVPVMKSVGTFCVGQPTTPQTISLTSTGTATIEMKLAPAMATASSPFTVAPQMPLAFPADIAPGASALVDITPNRRDTPAQMVTDALVWTTDVAGSSSTTNVAATFIADGAAIAPASIPFPPQPPHQFMEDSQPVTVQNCLTSGAPITLVPSINPPFSVDADFPTSPLSSGGSATFGVSFHPTHPGTFTGTLSISTSASAVPLTVALTGTSETTTPYLDAGSGSSTEPGQTSFYACSCTAHDPRGGLPIALALALALRPRRARRRA